MIQQILVFALLGVAVFFLVRTVYLNLKTGRNCASQCNKCGAEEPNKSLR
ncbi:MAG: FeoB-associated Cys-rich membrane protein [Cyclobacteriaceae bacterium]